MTIIHKSVLLNYSAEQMYSLVDHMENYPLFLPWCDRVDIQRDQAHSTALVTISLNFCGIKQSFTTYNVHTAPSSIRMKLVRGPFRKLTGYWSFQAQDKQRCRIELHLDYDFSHFFLEKLLGPVFDIVTNSLMDSFCQRAHKIYG